MIIDGKEWKLVPVEPNAAMVEAGISAIKQAPDVGGICAEYTAEAYDAYTAMLAAAPPAPVVEVTKATCAKVARANVDARLATAPDEILESATAIGKEEGGMSTSDEPREVAADLRTLSRFMHQAADAIWRLRLGAECDCHAQELRGAATTCASWADELERDAAK